MDILEQVDAPVDEARVRDASLDLLRALQAQHSAEDAHGNCPECEESERAWWTCESCSEHYGTAIEMRHDAMLKAGVLRVVSLEDCEPSGSATEDAS